MWFSSIFISKCSLVLVICISYSYRWLNFLSNDISMACFRCFLDYKYSNVTNNNGSKLFLLLFYLIRKKKRKDLDFV